MNSFTNREPITIPQQFALRSWVSLEPGLEENEWVLIDNRSGAICTCNDSAGVLLVALQNGTTCDQLADALTSRFDVSVIEARKDALLFIQQLSGTGFVYENF
ncbi:hypothetical protein A9Q75_13415 [Colwellia psychrerythraea]|uniref:PqqD family protein n=1 Tax=Colwellia psychrerythraea TaxID=28229 RepID=A0A1Y5EB94_COLPS|nr:hypothetical protein A9Q75_13415 [Colwellia psychrerythraea]